MRRSAGTPMFFLTSTDGKGIEPPPLLHGIVFETTATNQHLPTIQNAITETRTPFPGVTNRSFTHINYDGNIHLSRTNNLAERIRTPSYRIWNPVATPMCFRQIGDIGFEPIPSDYKSLWAQPKTPITQTNQFTSCRIFLLDA